MREHYVAIDKPLTTPASLRIKHTYSLMILPNDDLIMRILAEWLL